MRTYYETNLPVTDAEIYADFLRSNDFYFETSDYFGEYVQFTQYLSETEADACKRY